MAQSTALNANKIVLTQFEICKEIYESGLLSKYDMTAGAKLVLVGLANHYNPKTPDMYPSQEYLEERLGINERTIRRAIAQLSELGLIEYQTKKVNRYKFTEKFFTAVKMSYKNGQIVRLIADKMTDKQIHEQKNNNKVVSLNSKMPYRQEEGIKYKSPEQTQQEFKQAVNMKDQKNWKNDKETAIKMLEGFNNNPNFKKKIEEIKTHWKIQDCPGEKIDHSDSVTEKVKINYSSQF